MEFAGLISASEVIGHSRRGRLVGTLGCTRLSVEVLPFTVWIPQSSMELNWICKSFLFSIRANIVSSQLCGRLGTVLLPSAMVLTLTLLASVGCGESNESISGSTAAGPTVASPASEPGNDALADVLQRAKAGDIDAAIERLVTNVPDNWIESTALADFRMSEAAFAQLDRGEKLRLQQQFIDRVGELKSFTRLVIERANEANKSGDRATAERYLEAVNRLGRQLRDSDTVMVFQQTGKALAEVKLTE